MSLTKESLWMKILTIAGGIASIVGVVIALFADQNKAIIALLSVIVALIIIVGYAVCSLNKFIQTEHPSEYLKLSLFTTFEQTDNTHSKYDGYRLIQSKRPVLTQVAWGFKWTGKTLPKISSTLQECNGKINQKTNSYDEVVLQLKKPLKFNETTVLHFHSEMDDVDHSAQPHLDVKVDAPISVVYFRVILCNKDTDFAEHANFKRMPIDSKIPTAYETIETIVFDKVTRSYQYVLTNPEVGYFYRLEWVK